MSDRKLTEERIQAISADRSSETAVTDDSSKFPTILEAKRKYDDLAASHEAKSHSFERWKKDKDVQKQQEEASVERMFGHLSPELRRRSIAQHQAIKNAETQLNVERQYWKNAVGSITFEDPDQGSKTVIIPGVKPNVGPQVAFLSKTLDLKTPEQLGLLDDSNSTSESELEECESTLDS